MKKLFIYFLLKSDLTYYNLLERKLIKINILATDPKTKADSILLPRSQNQVHRFTLTYIHKIIAVPMERRINYSSNWPVLYLLKNNVLGFLPQKFASLLSLKILKQPSLYNYLSQKQVIDLWQLGFLIYSIYITNSHYQNYYVDPKNKPPCFIYLFFFLILWDWVLQLC